MYETLRQVASNVWIFPRDEDPNRTQPNVGIIVAGKHTILVDGGNSPRHARRIMIALDDIQAPAVSYVIYTHSHWDHVFGAMVFGAPAIGHELCRKQLMETATKPWSHAYIQEEIIRTPNRESQFRAINRAVEDWRNFRIVLPEIVLAKTLRLYLEGTTIEVEHVGGQHAPDSVIVRLPESRTLFLGDCFYPPPMHLRELEDKLDFPMMRSLVDAGIDTYIDGHGDPVDRAGFEGKIESGE